MKQNKIPRNEYIIKPKGKTNPYKHDVVYTNLGQWKYPGQVTRIPGDAFGTHITMKGINEPLYARDDQGNEQMMQPGEEYQFPGQYVTEYPQIAKNGGGLLNKTLTCPKCGWSWKAVDGGKDIATCHKCGGTAKLAYGGDPSLANIKGHYQNGGAQTPEEWEKQIRTVEHTIGNPSQWDMQGYNLLQNKLNDYKNWRENTPEGRAVHDSHNEPNEYVVPLPSHLQTVPKKPFGGIHTKTNTHMAKGGWLDSYQDGGKKIDMSKVKMDYYPKSNVEAQSRLDEEKAWENDYYRQQDKDYQNEVNAAVKKGIPRKQAELVIKRYKTDRYQATEQPVLSQGKKLNPSEQAYSDKVKARISNPSNDLGITAANMASALTRFRYLNPEEIAATTNNPSATAGLSSNIMTEALANEMAGPAFGKAFSSGAKNLTKKKLERQAINNFQTQHLDVPPPPSYEQYAANNLDPVSRENYQATFNTTPETRRLINSIDLGNYSLINDRLPNINNFSSSLDDLDDLFTSIKNRSGLTKKQALEKFAGKDKEALSKMSEKEFQETVIKPTGEVVKYKPALEVNQMGYNADLRDMQLKNAIPMSHEEYSNAFNERLDLLNDIIAKNNKSGVEYKVKGLDPGGNLIFETPSMPGADQRWLTTINPGQWRGKVEDIANSEYYKSIPGLDMRNTSSSVFGDRQPRRGSGAYESINEYLKGLDLGRVKPGFNSQTNSSQGLWENSIKKGNAFGFYSNPELVHGAMKSVLPYVGTGALGAAALQQEKFGGFLDAYDEGGNNPATSPTVAAIAANAKALKEEKDFDLIDSYLQEKRRVEGVRTRAAEIAANKAKSTNPSTRTNLSYIKNGAYYCNTHTGECFQDAGATTPTGKKVPVIPGNLQWDSEMKKLGFDWADTPQPGDIAREQLYKTSDYQGNPLSPGWYTSHSGVVTKGGKDLMIGNAPGGARNSYVNQPVDKMTGGRDPKTVHMKYQRYVGNLPGMQQDYDTIMKNLYSESIPSITPSYDFTAPLEERDIMPQSNLKYGGWLDDEQFRRGGQKGLKSFTSKNVYTSVNDIMLRNEKVFGPAGKRRYKPGLSYQDGGVYSIVDYLHSKGQDSSKENRQKLAEQLNVKDYDFTAEKNMELLSKLKDLEANPVAVKKASVKANTVNPIMTAFKPIDKRNIYGEEAVPTQQDYSHLSTAAQNQLNALAKSDPKVKETMATANKSADARLTLEKLAKQRDDKQRVADRYRKIRESQEAPDLLTREFWKDPRKNLALSTQATGDKFRLFPDDPNSFVDNWINPGVMIGNMASGLASAPLRAKEEDSYMPYVIGIGTPLVAGLIGAPLTKGASFKQGLKETVLQNIDVPGTSLLKNVGNSVITKTGLNKIKKAMPEVFEGSVPLDVAEKAGIKLNKNFAKQMDDINSPKYTEMLKTKGYTKQQVGQKQYEDLVTKLAESNVDDATMNTYLKAYPKKINTKDKLMKEYEVIKNSPTMAPKKKEGLYIFQESKPLNQKQVINDINAIPKKEKTYLIKELEQNPLYKAGTVKEKISNKISKKAFENTHMPIATKEQQVLAKNNEVMKSIFGESRTNVAKDIENVTAHIDNVPEGNIFLGSNSLSDSSFPLYALQAKRAIGQGKVKPVFLGYSPLNDFGHLTQTGTNQQTVLNHINDQITKFNSGFEKVAKLPNAFIKDGKIMYPNMALQKGKVSNLVNSTIYTPNYNKIAGATYKGLTKKESKPVINKITKELKKSNNSNEPYIPVSAPTFSHKKGGSVKGWLDNMY